MTARDGDATHGRVLAAPDKFKGTASAAEAATAIGHACWEAGLDCIEIPLADGGDGLLDVLGGPNRTSTVTGPLGAPVEASWRLSQGTAVIEMARASGLTLAGGAEHNAPLDATTAGTGELIDRALDAGAKRIIVGLGGSATTDGGLGALDAIRAVSRLRGVELLVACDVTTRFVDAAEVFAPQKGASPAHVRMLTRRLERLRQVYLDRFGVDVGEIDGGGAAGGLGGALAVLGGTLLPGFELVADEVDLYDAFDAGVDLVVTGEGGIDATSFDGKVVGGVLSLAAEYGTAMLLVAGTIDRSGEVAIRRAARDVDLTAIALVEQFGEHRAMTEPKWCIEQAVAAELTRRQR